MRTFDTGATRDADDDKYVYDGFLSRAVWERFAAYMHAHRQQADGKLRAADNWKKGIPKTAYFQSAFRHFMEFWKAHEENESTQEVLCALLFNVQGYLHEVIQEEGSDARS